MKYTYKVLVATVALGIGASLYAAPVAAQTFLRSYHQGAAAGCHAANPLAFRGYNDELGMLRSQTGYLNTNPNSLLPAHDVTVVCNPIGDLYAVNSASNVKDVVPEVQLFARNTRSNRDVTLTCTLYAGYIDSNSTSQLTQQIVLPADGTQRSLIWNYPDYTQFFPTPLSIVCNVPAGIELNDWITLYIESNIED